MMYVKSTPNHAGVRIGGDREELEKLIEALELVAGEEGGHPAYESIRLRVAALCAGLRDALALGGGEGGPEAKVLWPELLFVSVALNRFVQLYFRGGSKAAGWELTTARVRKFQESIVTCLRQNLPDSAFKPTANAIGTSAFLEENYATQYLDELNARFIGLAADKRLENLPLMAKRIVEQGEEYRKCKGSVLEAAKRYKCPPEDIRLIEELPDANRIVW